MLSSRVFGQIGVHSIFKKLSRLPEKQPNPWKISLNEISFNKNAALQHATLISQGKWK